MWVDAPNHIDLYDVEKYVGPALNKTVEWFNKYLGGNSRLMEKLAAWIYFKPKSATIHEIMELDVLNSWNSNVG